jgi:nucleoside-diphosphate-sugar epimerase
MGTLGNIVVTGGDGYLGRPIRQALQAESASRRNGCELFSAALERRIAECSVVVHMAACVDKRPEFADECFRVNAEGSRWMAERLRSGQTLIYCSTKDAYNSESELHRCVPETCSTAYERQTPYAWSKFLGEEYVRHFAARNGFRLGIFRLSTIMAPAPSDARTGGGLVSGFARIIRSGGELRLTCDGRRRRDILPATEAARAFSLFIASDIVEDTFNLGGGPAYAFSLAELAARIGEANGVAPKITLIPGEPDGGEQFAYVSDVSRLRERLGWTPSFDLDAHLRAA